MEILLWSLALLVSFYLIAYITDKYFVESLDKIAHDWKMSSDMAGATLMAVGSSAPELFISIIALFQEGEHQSLGLGTIVGSALFNILVIIGASAVARKSQVSWQPLIRDILFYFLAISFLIGAFFLGNNTGLPITQAKNVSVPLMVTFFFLGLYLLYVFAVVKWRKILPYDDKESNVHVEARGEEVPEVPVKGLKKIVLPFNWAIDKIFPHPKKHAYVVFMMAIGLIAALCWVLVESAVVIAEGLSIPSVIIGLTILAAGTSVPDMISSVIVAKQGRGGMAISNSIGSNIFDILIGLGIPWMITIALGNSVDLVTEGFLSSIVLLISSVILILVVFLITRWRIGKGVGWVFILLYVVYVLWEVLTLYL